MARSLSGWLKNQDPDVWFVTTDHLNWDNSVPLLKWIVSQPRCDKALAARIFWLADPAFFACKIAGGEGVPAWSESWPLIETILHNWRRGFYQRSDLAWPDDEGRACIANYSRKVAGAPGADKALDIPPDMFGPFRGRQPSVPPEMTPQENAELWDMFKRQGSWVGPRPGSDQWLAEREEAARAAPEPGFWSRLFR